MLNRSFSLVCGALAATLIVLASRSASAGGQNGALVRLQSTSPGATQTGNLNIDGTAIVGAFALPTGAAAGKVLKSDGSGNGTWQADGLSLPFSATGSANWPNGVLTVTNNDDGWGIYGKSTAVGGAGVQGRHTAAGYGYGVIGLGDGPGGTGVLGGATGTGATTGVHGYAYSTSGTGVSGLANATSGACIGVDGESKSTSGVGVFGLASSDSGSTYGVHGKTLSFAGIGVFGEATDSTGGNAGGYFKSISSSGVGVYGVATGTGTNIGVWGITNAPSGWGVYSDGRIGASGVKLFCIDHPFDPLNKFLQHYCSEGPEPLNVYTGNVTTDDKGEAWVTLPSYFEAINRDCRYTLTVVDDTDSESFALAKVARKMRDGRFKIRTSEPGVEVTWRVEGIRNDAWVQKYGAPVEVDKPDWQRGKYQHPELYGAPPEMGILPREPKK